MYLALNTEHILQLFVSLFGVSVMEETSKKRTDRWKMLGGVRGRIIELQLCGVLKHTVVLCSRNLTLFVCLFVMRDIELHFSLCVP